MAPDGQLRVAAIPAGRPGMSNPYAALYAGALRAQGATVDDPPFTALFRTRYDVVHLHWPEWVLDARSSRRTLTTLAALAWARRRGTRLVWTVHNLGHHEQHGRRAWAWNRFASMVDGFFSLTEGGVDAARREFPQLRDTPAFVVPHGHYRDAYPNTVTRNDARAHFGIALDARVVLFFGQVRPYKGVLELIDTFRALDDPQAVLVIAGRPVSEDLAGEVTRAAAGDTRIRVRLGLVAVDDVQCYFDAADVVVLPYAETFNSGAAMLALSFDRHVVGPASGAFPELQSKIGHAWVTTYDGLLTPEIIRAALERRTEGRAPLDDYSWTAIGATAMNAYRALIARRS